MAFSGLLSLSWWEVILYTLGVTHITIAAVTIFLHRHQAHRALELHPLVSHFFRFWLWLTTGMVTKEWAAVHRKHHAMCETEADPHSPQIRGLRAVLLRGAELYREEADRAETLERYGKGTPDDWLERHLYSGHSYLGIVLMLLLDLALLGPIGLTVWAVQMLWSPIFAAGVINGIGHYYGYRNAESPDASTNIVPWGILIGGEELHNNHHAWPGSARLSYQWWEFDIGWLYIRLLQAVGLARVKRVSPPPVQVVPAAEPDVEAVHAIVNYRLQVLARYGSQVIKRIHREELKRVASNRNLKGVFKRARDALLRDESLLDEAARRSVGMVLGHSQALAAAVEFRRRLQAIWLQAAGQPEKALQALQQWCREAEASGNRYLQQFARQLAGYRHNRVR